MLARRFAQQWALGAIGLGAVLGLFLYAGGHLGVLPPDRALACGLLAWVLIVVTTVAVLRPWRAYRIVSQIQGSLIHAGGGCIHARANGCTLLVRLDGVLIQFDVDSMLGRFSASAWQRLPSHAGDVELRRFVKRWSAERRLDSSPDDAAEIAAKLRSGVLDRSVRARAEPPVPGAAVDVTLPMEDGWRSVAATLLAALSGLLLGEFLRPALGSLGIYGCFFLGPLVAERALRIRVEFDGSLFSLRRFMTWYRVPVGEVRGVDLVRGARTALCLELEQGRNVEVGTWRTENANLREQVAEIAVLVRDQLRYEACQPE